MSNAYQKIKIVKLFASNEYKTRNKAHKVITKLLQFEFGNGNRQLNENDIIAIWKGLYIWLWMQDRPILHEEVVGKICKLLNDITSDKIAMEFITAFFVTMMREWKKIDIHRVDKFYMLTRDFLAASLLWLKNKDMTEWFASFLETNVFNGTIDQGVEFKLHLIDILIDELVKAECPSKLTTDILLTCIRSILFIGRKNIYVKKMKKCVIDRILPLYTESKLQVDLNKMGNTLSEFEKADNLFKCNKAFMKHLSVSCLNCKKNDGNSEIMDCSEAIISPEATPCDNIEQQTILEDVTMDDTVNGSDVQNKDYDNEVNDTAETCDSEEETSSDEVPTMPMKALIKPPKAVAGKRLATKAPKKTKIVMENASKDRKVTFGKKYTKKFKKGDVKVSTSQGTIKNTEMKSILKKK